VREAARLGAPENPAAVSQRAFDAARYQSTRFADLPLARDIARQLRMPWAEVLEIAHSPVNGHSLRLGRAHTESAQDWLTPEYIAYVLKLVAHRLGSSSVSPGQYRVERERMLALNRSRYMHGRQLRLPTDNQIRIALRAASVAEPHRDTPTAGAWDAALVLAGLEPEPRRERAVIATGTVEMLERCYEAHGAEPAKKELEAFAKSNGIPYSRDRKQLWAVSVAAWKESRQSRGLPIPAGPPPLSERSDYARDLGAAYPGERRHLNDWSGIEDCVEHVRAYLEQLPAGVRSTKKSYNDWALARPGRPAYSAFDQHGGWGRLRELAQARMLRSEDS
jgi:hypothetical protein